MTRELPDMLSSAVPTTVAVPDLDAIESRVARRRVGRVAGASLAVVAALGIVLPALPDGPIDAPIIDQPTEPTTDDRPTQQPTEPDAAPTGTATGPALDITALRPMGDAGLAVQTDDGLELFTLDGTSIGVLAGLELAEEQWGMQGGAIRAWSTSYFRHVWVSPSDGQVLPGDDILPLSGGEALVREGDAWRWPSAWADLTDPLVLAGDQPRVGMAGSLVTTADCTYRSEGCENPVVVDLDIGGTGVQPQGCVAADKFGDFNQLSVCNADGESWLLAPGVDAGGAEPTSERIEMPRYTGAPATIGQFTGAVFGGPGLVTQLSMECELPVAIGFEDGEPVGLFGGTWEDEIFESYLLGKASGIEDGSLTPIVQVPAESLCGGDPAVTPGVYAIGEDGAVLLNELTGPMMLWTSLGPDLALAGQSVIDSYAPTYAPVTDGTVLVHATAVDDELAITGTPAGFGQPLASLVAQTLETGWPWGREIWEGTSSYGEPVRFPVARTVIARVTPDDMNYEEYPIQELQYYLDDQMRGEEGAYVLLELTLVDGVVTSIEQRIET